MTEKNRLETSQTESLQALLDRLQDLAVEKVGTVGGVRIMLTSEILTVRAEIEEYVETQYEIGRDDGLAYED